jgi:hypothetical protein
VTNRYIHTQADAETERWASCSAARPDRATREGSAGDWLSAGGEQEPDLLCGGERHSILLVLLMVSSVMA